MVNPENINPIGKTLSGASITIRVKKYAGNKKIIKDIIDNNIPRFLTKFSPFLIPEYIRNEKQAKTKSTIEIIKKLRKNPIDNIQSCDNAPGERALKL